MKGKGNINPQTAVIIMIGITLLLATLIFVWLSSSPYSEGKDTMKYTPQEMIEHLNNATKIVPHDGYVGIHNVTHKLVVEDDPSHPVLCYILIDEKQNAMRLYTRRGEYIGSIAYEGSRSG